MVLHHEHPDGTDRGLAQARETDEFRPIAVDTVEKLVKLASNSP
jgi:hypothetical protein